MTRHENPVTPDQQGGNGATETALPADGRLLFDAVPIPLLMVDRGRTVRIANSAARGIFGADTAGRSLALVIRHPDALEAVERAIASGRPAEREFSVAGAIPRSYVLGIGPITGGGEPEGDPSAATGAVLSFYEITAIDQAEKMRADFVANVSHELRTPLSSLIGFIETLSGLAIDDAEARQRFLSIMARESERMSRLIDDLLSLSRIERDEHIPPEHTVDLGTILRNVVNSLSVRAADHNMDFVVELPEPVAEVIGEADQLTQVFQNIVDNAVKYGREGTVITITAAPVGRLPETSGAGISISVTDCGDGIPQHLMPRITERFYRVDTARSRALGGTGLGLAIVKHIVSRHQGTLTISSEEGIGTTVTVCLPVAAVAVPAGNQRGR